MDEAVSESRQVEELLALLTSERSLVEKFKSSFFQLKYEYDSRLKENEKLEEAVDAARRERDEARRQLEDLTRRSSDESKFKDQLLTQAQAKLKETDERLRLLQGDKESVERELIGKLQDSQCLLEMTKSTLFQLQSDSALLRNAVEDVQERSGREKNELQLELQKTIHKLNKEKELLSAEIQSVSARTIRKISHFQRKNNLLEVTIQESHTNLVSILETIKTDSAEQKLEESVQNLAAEKSSLSLELETLKAQLSHQTGEWAVKLQHYEGNEVKMIAKVESLEAGLGQVSRQRNEAEVKNTILEKQIADLEEKLRQKEKNCDMNIEKIQRENQAVKNRFEMEIEILQQKIRSLQQELDFERNSLAQTAERLRVREKELEILEANLRKEEAENLKLMNRNEIDVENKYRGLLNEQTVRAAELTGKIADLEGRLARARLIEEQLATETSGLKTELSGKKQTLEQNEILRAENQFLRRKIELLESDLNELRRNLEEVKAKSDQKLEECLKVKDLSVVEHSQMEKDFFEYKSKLLEEMSALKSENSKKANDLKLLEEKTRLQIEKEREKSKTYAKLIWKLRHKLAAREDDHAVTGTTNTLGDKMNQ